MISGVLDVEASTRCRLEESHSLFYYIDILLRGAIR